MEKILKKTRFDLLHVFIGCLGLVSGMAIGIYGVKTSERIAEESGAFAKPVIRLFVGDKATHQDKATTVVFGFPDENASMVFGRLPLQIRNEGSKTVEELLVVFRYSGYPERRLVEYMLEWSPPHWNPSTVVRRSIGRIGTFDYTAYSIPILNPGESVFVSEPMLFDLPEQAHSIEYCLDGLIYSNARPLDIMVSVTGKNFVPIDQKLQILVHKATSLDDLTLTINQEAPGAAHTFRRQFSFLQYLALLTRETSCDAILEFPDQETLKFRDSTRVFLGTIQDSTRKIEFDPVSFRLLF